MAFSDWRPGMLLTAERLRGSTPQGPLPWSPVWGTTSGAATPSFGNSDIDALYTHFGRMCHGHMGINFGSTADFGTGASASDNWTFSAPVPAAKPEQIVGMGELWPDGSTPGLGGRVVVRVRMVDTVSFSLEISSGRVNGDPAGGEGVVDSITPYNWAAAYNIYFHFAYFTAF